MFREQGSKRGGSASWILTYELMLSVTAEVECRNKYSRHPRLRAPRDKLKQVILTLDCSYTDLRAH